MRTALLVAQQAEARSLKKRTNDDLTELLREFINASLVGLIVLAI